MSLSAGPPPLPGEQAERRARIRSRIWTLLFAVFALEIGGFLAVFPWLDQWSLNHLPSLFLRPFPAFQDYWDEPTLRGAISGLGLVNVYIAFRQLALAMQRVRH